MNRPTHAQTHMDQLIEIVDHHHVAMEDEGYSRAADLRLWTAGERAHNAAAIQAAIAEHRERIGVYALSVDEELWECAEEMQRTVKGLRWPA